MGAACDCANAAERARACCERLLRGVWRASLQVCSSNALLFSAALCTCALTLAAARSRFQWRCHDPLLAAPLWLTCLVYVAWLGCAARAALCGLRCDRCGLACGICRRRAPRRVEHRSAVPLLCVRGGPAPRDQVRRDVSALQLLSVLRISRVLAHRGTAPPAQSDATVQS